MDERPAVEKRWDVRLQIELLEPIDGRQMLMITSPDVPGMLLCHPNIDGVLSDIGPVLGVMKLHIGSAWAAVSEERGP